MHAILSACLLPLVVAADGEPAPKLPIGKDTTVVDGPLGNDGYIDFEAALNDRLGAGVTAEKNANVLIWKLVGPTPEGAHMPAAFFKRLGIDEPPADGDYFVPLYRYLKDHSDLDSSEYQAVYDQQSRAGRRPWSAKDYPLIAGWLEANEKPLALAIEATRRPDYYNPLVSRRSDKQQALLIGALLPAVQKCRELATAFAARALLRVKEGKFDDAWQDLLACHRLGRLLSRGGTLIEALVGIAIEAVAASADLAYLERADLTTEQARMHMKELQELPALAPLADKVDVAERFCFLDSAQFVRRGGRSSLDALSGSSPPSKPDPDAEKSLAGLDWKMILRGGNSWYDRMVAAMHLKNRVEREKELDGIDKELKALKAASSPPWNVTQILLGKDPPEVKASKAIGDALVTQLIPAVRKVQGAYDRHEQLRRNLQLAFAMAAYHRDQGKYPPKLDDLTPKYVAAVPDDVFSGAALIYRAGDKGYTFYSVGQNGKDDGGRSFDDDPRGDDLPVIMPLPELKQKK
jgi:hypothetical protein